MFKIVKGWPSESALDPVLSVKTGEVLSTFDIAQLDSNGELSKANYDTGGSDASDQAVIVLDVDTVFTDDSDNPEKVAALLQDVVVECDSDHYQAGSYEGNTAITAVSGEFSPVSASEREIGRVLSYNATSGKLLVKFTG